MSKRSGERELAVAARAERASWLALSPPTRTTRQDDASCGMACRAVVEQKRRPALQGEHPHNLNENIEAERLRG